MKSLEPMHSPVAVRSGAPQAEVLTFRIGPEEYAVDILKVREIRGYEAVTRIANTPTFIKGVVNLRGAVVPILDLRIQFNLAEPRYDQFTVVVILNVSGRVIGIVVDAVSDVIGLLPDQIRPAPRLAAAINADCITGIGVAGERMLILLDIERLMSSPAMALIDRSVH